MTSHAVAIPHSTARVRRYRQAEQAVWDHMVWLDDPAGVARTMEGFLS